MRQPAASSCWTDKFWRRPSSITILTETGRPREVVFEFIVTRPSQREARCRKWLVRYVLLSLDVEVEFAFYINILPLLRVPFKTLRAGHWSFLVLLTMLWPVDWRLRIPDVTDPMLTSLSNDSLVHFCQRKLKSQSVSFLPRTDSGEIVQLRLWS